MKSMDEINEKLTELKEKEEGIINTTEPITNEISVILVGSQLQQAVIKAVMSKDESEIEKMVEKETKKLKKLNEDYAIASEKGDMENKRALHAAEWTCDIKLNTLQWILGNTLD
ncbi:MULTISPECIES: hypothetical protein [unclassified Methanobrevibacter]|jgi:DNA-binding Lrp family transcriptional regulator|uniref:hypothetical protein n=1 Tax=unclassified Methanobrevibacter TaxID=2638681 RepID=UPI0039B9BA80